MPTLGFPAAPVFPQATPNMPQRQRKATLEAPSCPNDRFGEPQSPKRNPAVNEQAHQQNANHQAVQAASPPANQPANQRAVKKPRSLHLLKKLAAVAELSDFALFNQ